MIKIAIVDDTATDIETVKALLSKYMKEQYKIYEFSTAENFIHTLEHTKYDIIFLDIVLGEVNGIFLGETINQRQPKANIIFISANPEYFKDVYKVTHSYFLIKDFEEDRFADAVKKAITQIKKEFIIIDTKHDKQKILLDDVLFFESYLKHSKLYWSNGTIDEYNINLKNIEKLLPKHGFVRTHKSFIINMKYIKKYDRQNVMMGENHSVPISRNYLNESREKMALYLGGAQ